MCNFLPNKENNMTKRFKVMEVHTKTALQISDEIGPEFAKGNSNYRQIQLAIEKKYGYGSVMLALRALAGAYRMESIHHKYMEEAIKWTKQRELAEH